MTEEIRIESLKLKIGKAEFDVTIQEAKDLKKALDELLGRDVHVVKEHHHHSYPTNWWNRPYLTYYSTSKGGEALSTSKGSVSLSAVCDSKAIEELNARLKGVR